MKRAVYDIAALIARVVVGVIFVAHGWQKWQGGLGATSEGFAQMGVPQPQLAAAFSTVVETVGGALLIIGLLVRPAALLLLIGMIGAIAFAHWNNGVFVQEGGWELAAALGSVALLLLALGGGRLGLDGIIHGIYRKRAQRRAAEKASAGRPAPAHREDTQPVYRDEQPGYRPERPPREDTQPVYRDDTQTGYREDAGPGPQDETRQHPVPRQPSGHRSDALSEEDMRDVNALIGDEQRRPPKPPNR
ncbi:DoxX family protein [Nonomuraea sp. NPDC049714]|uniref:DoxX family protein n=1 Tax=Nonomuraea sp. NPDC049714 TaxID=3364357 RepID=UPI0037B1F920